MKTVQLTELEIWFIECAIELKNAVLPLDPQSLDARIFKKDYGKTKKEVEQAIKSLKQKIS